MRVKKLQSKRINLELSTNAPTKSTLKSSTPSTLPATATTSTVTQSNDLQFSLNLLHLPLSSFTPANTSLPTATFCVSESLWQKVGQEQTPAITEESAATQKQLDDANNDTTQPKLDEIDVSTVIFKDTTLYGSSTPLYRGADECGSEKAGTPCTSPSLAPRAGTKHGGACDRDTFSPPNAPDSADSLPSPMKRAKLSHSSASLSNKHSIADLVNPDSATASSLTQQRDRPVVSSPHSPTLSDDITSKQLMKLVRKPGNSSTVELLATLNRVSPTKRKRLTMELINEAKRFKKIALSTALEEGLRNIPL